VVGPVSALADLVGALTSLHCSSSLIHWACLSCSLCYTGSMSHAPWTLQVSHFFLPSLSHKWSSWNLWIISTSPATFEKNWRHQCRAPFFGLSQTSLLPGWYSFFAHLGHLVILFQEFKKEIEASWGPFQHLPLPISDMSITLPNLTRDSRS
jgi:hypothetical protein